MIKAFLNGEDIHTATAAEINQVVLPDVTPAMRREAKAVNFGILYGQGPHGLAAGADIPLLNFRLFAKIHFLLFRAFNFHGIILTLFFGGFQVKLYLWRY